MQRKAIASNGKIILQRAPFKKYKFAYFLCIFFILEFAFFACLLLIVTISQITLMHFLKSLDMNRNT